MDDKIDITITATLRPELLKRTLDSFCENLFTDKDRYRLIINVDAIGEEDCKPEQILEIVEEYFSNVTYNICLENFSRAKAMKWVWSKVKADFTIPVDDDWLLLKKANIDDLITIHKEVGNLACLRFINTKDKEIPKVAKRKIKFRNQLCNCVFMTLHLRGKVQYAYYKGALIDTGNKFNNLCLRPGLFRGDFVRQVVKFLRTDIDPELQLKFRTDNRKIEKIIKKNWEIGIYGKPGDSSYIQDIGRPWMMKSKFESFQKTPLTATKWRKK